ncbi:uncharacterized protein TM35_000331270 [Trypanosoma theileri]|uniref:Uncharacterized protein n=1 Tax=Trypanosoma theileri TaxID=67003 RepID=A0A1X0NNF2_9TRYP|nr:uncharacterized protein TM35_000331270 [Trypanosoma theileri]ORC85670.1 hypothetical protein TM35_000331270 [Trypanosoma theileri]
MSVSLDDISLNVLGEYCVLCNVWIAGNAVQHVSGEKHQKWSEAARTLFRRTAPAACVLAATLLLYELKKDVRDHYCVRCCHPVGGGFRQAVQHIGSKHHAKRQMHPPRASQSVVHDRPSHLCDLVHEVICPLCDCVVPTQPERHLLSGRHQRNLQNVSSCESQMQVVMARREMWCESLLLLKGNICCSCVEYIPTENIMSHFTSPHHKTSAASTAAALNSSNCVKKENVGNLHYLLECAHQFTVEGYCAVCDLILRSTSSSTLAHHKQEKRHNMQLLRARRDPVASLELWQLRLTAAAEKHEKRVRETSTDMVDPTALTTTTPRTPECDAISNKIEDDHCLDPKLVRDAILNAPLLFFFVNGRCILCDMDVVPQCTHLIASSICKKHCSTPKHKSALELFLSKHKIRDAANVETMTEAGAAATTVEWAARWYEAVFRSLRENPLWQEPAETERFHTYDDFIELIQDEKQSLVFTDALCASVTPSGIT